MKRFGLFLMVVLLAACGPRATIKGLILCAGEGADTVYLEEIAPDGQHIVDSAAIDKGKFRFKVALQGKYPALYNIKYGHHVVPLVVSPGEKISVKGMGNVSRNYFVTGSEGSQQMRELVTILNGGAARLDSLINIYATLGPGDTMRNHITRQYASDYYGIKREQIRFIVSNPSSMAALYGLYQRLPNDNVLFTGTGSDVVYFRLVADSLEVRYPGSPYLKALRADIERMGSGNAFDLANVHTINYPDIDMPDMYGKRVKLSSLEGNVVLIDFWSASVPQCRLFNADLKELYGEWHAKGFEVYQVAVDVSKPLWVNTVQEQKLPWVTVCDFRGESSAAVASYNVSAVPANFLLDRQGNLVGKNLYGKDLENKVKSLL